MTRIPLEYLKALEAGDLEVIPNPIRRGVVAAYAKAAGMNAEKVLKSLEDLGQKSVETTVGNLSTERPLREAMTVGMTRAQIRTAWFAQIAANRLLHWALSLTLLVIAVVVGAHWLREEQEAEGIATQFSLDTAAYRTFSYVQMIEPVADSLRSLIEFDRQQTIFIAHDTGHAFIMAGLDVWADVFLYPHDTIEFRHFSGLRFAVDPRFRGLVVQETDTLVTHFTKDSLVAWYCSPDAIAPDSAQTDSLAAKVKG